MSLNTLTSITFTWDQGLSDGGTNVLDYTLLWTSGTVFTTLKDGITDNTYTVTGLTNGASYKFRISARNKFGLSAPSAVLDLIAGTYPEAPPAAPTTVRTLDYIDISWTQPLSNNGAPITYYKVYIRSAALTYELE